MQSNRMMAGLLQLVVRSVVLLHEMLDNKLVQIVERAGPVVLGHLFAGSVEEDSGVAVDFLVATKLLVAVDCAVHLGDGDVGAGCQLLC